MPAAKLWSLILSIVICGIGIALVTQSQNFDWILVIGLSIFGFAFAVNSSIHSYLILAYAGSEKAAEDIGFYYAANAAGRFLGTFLSGTLYSLGGIQAYIWCSSAMLLICWITTLGLPIHIKENNRNSF